jgi:hypothetical protein
MPPSKCNIVIVEDDASLRRAVERLLCASGFEALARPARNAHESLVYQCTVSQIMVTSPEGCVENGPAPHFFRASWPACGLDNHLAAHFSIRSASSLCSRSGGSDLFAHFAIAPRSGKAHLFKAGEKYRSRVRAHSKRSGRLTLWRRTAPLPHPPPAARTNNIAHLRQS